MVGRGSHRPCSPQVLSYADWSAHQSNTSTLLGKIILCINLLPTLPGCLGSAPVLDIWEFCKDPSHVMELLLQHLGSTHCQSKERRTFSCSEWAKDHLKKKYGAEGLLLSWELCFKFVSSKLSLKIQGYELCRVKRITVVGQFLATVWIINACKYVVNCISMSA